MSLVCPASFLLFVLIVSYLISPLSHREKKVVWAIYLIAFTTISLGFLKNDLRFLFFLIGNEESKRVFQASLRGDEKSVSRIGMYVPHCETPVPNCGICIPPFGMESAREMANDASLSARKRRVFRLSHLNAEVERCRKQGERNEKKAGCREASGQGFFVGRKHTSDCPVLK